jgi:hypothetical protein
MAQETESTLFWNPDGYVEIVFVGVQKPETLQQFDVQTRELLLEHGRASVLIDARRGRVGRDANSLSFIMKMARSADLDKFVVLIDPASSDPEVGKKSGVLVSMVTAALGKRPIYLYDEAEARARAASDR